MLVHNPNYQHISRHTSEALLPEAETSAVPSPLLTVEVEEDVAASIVLAWRWDGSGLVFVLPPEGIPNTLLLVLAVASARLLQVGISNTHRVLHHRSAILMLVVVLYMYFRLRDVFLQSKLMILYW